MRLQKEDSWATNNSDVTDAVNGSWSILNHPAYYTLAAQYRGKTASIFFSYTAAYTLVNDMKSVTDESIRYFSSYKIIKANRCSNNACYWRFL